MEPVIRYISLLLISALACPVAFGVDKTANEVADRAEDSEKGEGERLRGKWRVLSYVDDGKELLGDRSCTATITKDRLTLEQAEAKLRYEMKYRIANTAKMPRWIEVAEVKDGRPGKMLPGIYRLQRNKLSICFNESSIEGTRPSEFKSTATNSCIFIVLERVEKRIDDGAPENE